MVKTILGQVKEFKKDSLITPVCMILEVIMEMVIPLLMAAVIDNGVEKGDMGYIYKTGAVMMLLALLGLFSLLNYADGPGIAGPRLAQVLPALLYTVIIKIAYTVLAFKLEREESGKGQ